MPMNSKELLLNSLIRPNYEIFLKNVARLKTISPQVFISYAWPKLPEEEDLQLFLAILYIDLASYLNLQVIWDIKSLEPGMDIDKFMREGVNTSPRIIMIGTPTYGERARDSSTNVHKEVSHMAYKRIREPDSVIPLLYCGNWATVFPDGYGQVLALTEPSCSIINFYRNITKILFQLLALPPEKRTDYDTCEQEFLAHVDRVFSTITDNQIVTFEQTRLEQEKLKIHQQKQQTAEDAELVYQQHSTQLQPQMSSLQLLALEGFRKALDQHYESEGIIKRLFYPANPLPLSSIFVNLAIVHQIKEQQQETPGTTPGNSNTEAPYTTIQEIIDLSELFKLTAKEKEIAEKQQQTRENPKRVLILADAGMGKTTLCKKFALEYPTLFNNQFLLVFHISLRTLAHDFTDIYAEINLVTLIARQFLGIFSQLTWEREKISAFSQAILNQSKRILWILDGWDEIAASYHNDTKPQLKRLLDALLSQLYVIVTSRTQVTPPITFDRKLTNLGFTDDNINVYVSSFFKNLTPPAPEKGVRLLEAAHANPNINSMIRIPINAELISTIWDRRERTNLQTNLTELYNEIKVALVLRDFEKKNSYDSEHATDAEIFEDPTYQACCDFLEEIAYAATCQKKSILDSRSSQVILNLVRRKYTLITVRLFEAILKLGFLTAVSEDRRIIDRDYSFLHLTFQEYFTACYMAKQLIVSLIQTTEQTEEIIHFIRENKYDPNYQMTLKFLAGRLRDNEDALNLFFELLLSEPRSLIGSYEMSLLIQSLEECGVHLKLYHRQQMLEKILAEFQFSFKKFNCSKIEFFKYLNCAPTVLNESGIFKESILMSQNPDRKLNYTITSLWETWTMTQVQKEEILQVLLSYFPDSDDSSESAAYHRIIGRISWTDEQKERIFLHFSGYLLSSEVRIKQAPIELLGQQFWNKKQKSQLSSKLLQYLESKDIEVRNAVISTLRKLLGVLEQEIILLPYIISCLQSSEVILNNYALAILRELPFLPSFIFFDNTYTSCVFKTSCEFSWTEEQSNQVFPHLLIYLRHPDSIIKHNAIKTLLSFSWTSEQKNELLPLLITILRVANQNIRHDIIDILKQLSWTSEQKNEILHLLITILPGANQNIRHDIIDILEQLSWNYEQSTQIFSHLLFFLKDSDLYIRHKAIKTINKLSLTSDQSSELLPHLISCLEYDNDAFIVIGKLPWTLEQKNELFIKLMNCLQLPIKFTDNQFNDAFIVIGKLPWTLEQKNELFIKLMNCLQLPIKFTDDQFSDNHKIKTNALRCLNEFLWNQEQYDEIFHYLLTSTENNAIDVIEYYSYSLYRLGKISWDEEQRDQFFRHLLPCLISYCSHQRATAILNNYSWTPEQNNQIFLFLMFCLQDCNLPYLQDYYDYKVLVLKILITRSWNKEQSDQFFPHLLSCLQKPDNNSRQSDRRVRKAAIKTLNYFLWNQDQSNQLFRQFLNYSQSYDFIERCDSIEILKNPSWTTEQKRKIFKHLLVDYQRSTDINNDRKDLLLFIQSDFAMNNFPALINISFDTAKYFVEMNKIFSKVENAVILKNKSFSSLMSLLEKDQSTDKEFIQIIFRLAVYRDLTIYISNQELCCVEEGKLCKHICTNLQLRYLKETKIEILNELKLPMLLQLPVPHDVASSSSGASHAAFLVSSRLERAHLPISRVAAIAVSPAASPAAFLPLPRFQHQSEKITVKETPEKGCSIL